MRIVAFEFNESFIFIDDYKNRNIKNFINKILNDTKLLEKKIDDNTSGYFVSTVLPNPKDEHPSWEEKCSQFSVKECENVSMIGLPLSLRHRNDIFKKVGIISDNYFDGNDFIVTAKCSPTVEGRFAVNSLIDRKYDDVSLQHWAFSDPEEQFVAKQLIEVSLCKEGRRYGSSVFLLLTKNYPQESQVFVRGERTYLWANIDNIEKYLERNYYHNDKFISQHFKTN